MHKYSFPYVFSILTIFVSIGLGGCSKSDQTPQKTTSPTDLISSIDVNSGPYSTSVTITGVGFSAIATDQQVFFNGKEAIITSASTTKIVTSVPLGAGTGAVSVKFKDGKTVSGPLFTYQGTLWVNTFAGSGQQGYADGIGKSAIFNTPFGIAVDKTGNVFVADAANNMIRKITPDGTVSTFAGSGSKASTDGSGTSASFYGPQFITIDVSGNLFVTEASPGNRIRKITPNAVVTTYAGSQSGYMDGVAGTAQFGTIYGITTDKGGNVYVCDAGNGCIRKVTPAGLVSTLYKNAITFNYPFQILTDQSNNLYFSNLADETIRKATPDGVLTYVTNLDGTHNFGGLQGMTIDSNGIIYVSDNSVIKKIVSDKVVSDFAGSGSAKSPSEGPAADVFFITPQGMAADASGNLYVAQGLNNIISKISTQ